MDKAICCKAKKIKKGIKKDTELLREVADVWRQKEILEIKVQEQILKGEGKQKILWINNQKFKEKENSLANIAKHTKDKQAESNRKLYSPEADVEDHSKSLKQNSSSLNMSRYQEFFWPRYWQLNKMKANLEVDS